MAFECHVNRFHSICPFDRPDIENGRKSTNFMTTNIHNETLFAKDMSRYEICMFMARLTANELSYKCSVCISGCRKTRRQVFNICSPVTLSPPKCQLENAAVQEKVMS